ncbi:nucleotidyltransferase family protein [Amylibacter sp.]|jgi:hypothetical protein|nr:nucleotidyltransferase family protein [Amylibacter sp.]
MIKLKLDNAECFLSEIICHRDSLNKERIASLFETIGEKNCFDLCEKNNVTCIAYDALNQCSGITISRCWKNSFYATEKRIREYMSELDKVSALLAKHGIPLIALKNSGIARSLYPILGASPMGDLDVLVDKADFRNAHSALTKFGYSMKFRSPLEEEDIDSAEQHGGAEYSVTLESGNHLWFELQWRPIAGRWIRVDQEPSATDLIKRSVEIDGSQARLLSPEDNLLQVALHTAKHTYVRAPGFRLHTDVDRVVRSTNIDWDKFVEEVKRIEVKTAVFLSLALAHKLLRTPVPERVLIDIAPGNLKSRVLILWLQRVGLFYPDRKKWGRFGYIIFVALLYDNLLGLFKSILPPPAVIRNHYSNYPNRPLVWLYIIRIIDLINKRVLIK